MSVWDGIKKALGVAAPVAASMIGGPAAGAAVSAVSNALFGHPNASEDEIVEALKSATPEQLLALKQADLELSKLDLQETQSARDRELSFLQIMGSRDWTMGYLVFFMTAMYAALVFFNMYVPDATEKESLKDLSTFLGIVIGYYFGRSK